MAERRAEEGKTAIATNADSATNPSSVFQNEFEDEALEGLQEFKDKEQLQYMTEMLNRDLKKKTEKKKKRREKMQLKDQPWLYISILILLLLIVLSYLVIRKRLG